jgi:hypothetical protein
MNGTRRVSLLLGVGFVAAMGSAEAGETVSATIAGGYMRSLGWGGEVGMDVQLRPTPGDHGWYGRASVFAGDKGGKATLGVLKCCVGPGFGFGEIGVGGDFGLIAVQGAVSRPWAENADGTITWFLGAEVEYSLAEVLKVGGGVRFPVAGSQPRTGEATFGVTLGLPLWRR